MLEVIVPALAPRAAFRAIEVAGFLPIVVDVRPGLFVAEPVKIARACSFRTQAILLPYTFGNVADVGAIREIADVHDAILIEDITECSGFYDSTPVGSFGDIVVDGTSFSVSADESVEAVLRSFGVREDSGGSGGRHGESAKFWDLWEEIAPLALHAQLPEKACDKGEPDWRALPLVFNNRTSDEVISQSGVGQRFPNELGRLEEFWIAQGELAGAIRCHQHGVILPLKVEALGKVLDVFA